MSVDTNKCLQMYINILHIAADMSMGHLDMSIDTSFVLQVSTRNQHCNIRHLQLSVVIMRK